MTEMHKKTNTSIKARFFEAVSMLIANGTIRGRQTYCRLYEIDKRHYYAQEKDLGLSLFRTSWLVPLVAEYGVNATWLLTGKGGMFYVDDNVRKLRASRYNADGTKREL